MTKAFVAGVAVHGPGLPGWEASRRVFAGLAPLTGDTPPLPPPAILAPNERRRAGAVIRLALTVASEASAMAALDPAALRSVFASANGDSLTLHNILMALTEPGGQVSPTQFHNSVHNAPAGYWSIGARATQATICLGCYDFTVAAALMKAVAETAVECQTVLLCVYDLPMPEPLNACRPTRGGFGAALVLTPEASPASLAALRIRYQAGPADPAREPPRHPGLAALSLANPAARILRLLETLALGEPDHLAMTLLDGCLDVTVTPCSTVRASSP